MLIHIRDGHGTRVLWYHQKSHFSHQRQYLHLKGHPSSHVEGQGWRTAASLYKKLDRLQLGLISFGPPTTAGTLRLWSMFKEGKQRW